jgi:hypothetical protein
MRQSPTDYKLYDNLRQTLSRATNRETSIVAINRVLQNLNVFDVYPQKFLVEDAIKKAQTIEVPRQLLQTLR